MKKPSKNRSGKRTDFGKLRPESPGVPWAPIRLPKINKTHTDILQKDNIQEDNLKEDYLKEDYLHEPQAMGRVNLRKKVTFGGVQKKTFRKS